VLKFLKWTAIVVGVLFVGGQFFRPARTNPPFDEAQTIQAQTQMTPEVATIFIRSCSDCHSNRTRWPWYTNVVPVSWFVVGHVENARSNMNLSEWGRHDRVWQDRKLRQICDEIEEGAMPLGSYTPLHPGSNLTRADVKTLCDWTKAERERLKSR